MVLPLIPIAAAVIGAGAGAGLISLFGGGGGKASATYESKKDLAGTEVHAPYESYQYAPTRNVTIQNITDSPFASTSKKDVMTASPTLSGESGQRQYDISPAAGSAASGSGASGLGSAETGTDMSKLVLVGAIGLIGYGYVTS